MEVTRLRFGSVLEWLLAAACILAVLGLGSLALDEFRVFKAVTPVIAEEASIPEPTAGVPARAVSVPMLVLSNGVRIRIGDRASTMAPEAAGGWQIGSDAIERGVNGDRVTRSYDDGRRQFVIVFEPSARGAEPRVAAIYLR